MAGSPSCGAEECYLSILQKTNPSRDPACDEDSVPAALEWHLAFQEPRSLSVAWGCEGTPGASPGTPPRNPAAVRRAFSSSSPPREGAVVRAGRELAASGPRGQARCLQDVHAPGRAVRAARDPPLLAAVLQRPAVPSRRVRDCELRVLGCHQRGGRRAGQRLHRGSAARAAGGLEQPVAAELPRLGSPGGRALAAPDRGGPRQATPSAPGMFSYRRESGPAAGAPPDPRLRAGTARSLAHASAWGCLATVSAHEKVSHPGWAPQAVAWRVGGAPRSRGEAGDPSGAQIWV